MTVLTFTTGLTSVFHINIRVSFNCFSVSNLWSTNISFYFEFTQQTVNDDFQVKFTHTSDDCLTCFFVCVSFECWVFFCQFSKGNTHFFLASFCFWFDSYTDNWFWEFHGFQNYWVFFITQCVTCSCIFKTYCSSDITCVTYVDVLTVVSVHLQNTAHSFSAVFYRVVNC